MSEFKKSAFKSKDIFDTSNEDFEAPIVFKKFKSDTEPTIPKVTRKKKPSKKKQLTLHQVYEQNFRYSDVNADQLQLALALSRSISEDSCSTKEEFPLSPSKYTKKTLLEFGFRTNRPKISVENKLIRKEPSKINKKSKYRFVTPILYMRTDEERNSIIQSKLSSIITGETTATSCDDYGDNSSIEISSMELKKLRCPHSSIFKLDQSAVQQFKVSDLNIEILRAKSGSLLKDWKKIPLRDQTPERLKRIVDQVEESKSDDISINSSSIVQSVDSINIPNVKVQESTHTENVDFLRNSRVVQNNRNDGSISPDLFDSDISSCDITALSHSSKIKKNLNNLFIEANMNECNVEELKLNNDDSKNSIPTLLDYQSKNYVSNLDMDFEKHSLKNKNEQEFPERNNCEVSYEEPIILSSDEEYCILNDEFVKSSPENMISDSCKSKNVLVLQKTSFEVEPTNNDISVGDHTSQRTIYKDGSITRAKKLYSLSDEETELVLEQANLNKKSFNSDQVDSKIQEHSSNQEKTINKNLSGNIDFTEEVDLSEEEFLCSFKDLDSNETDENTKTSINITDKCDSAHFADTSNNKIVNSQINNENCEFRDSLNNISNQLKGFFDSKILGSHNSFEKNCETEIESLDADCNHDVNQQKSPNSNSEKLNQVFTETFSDSLLNSFLEKNSPSKCSKYPDFSNTNTEINCDDNFDIEDENYIRFIDVLSSSRNEDYEQDSGDCNKSTNEEKTKQTGSTPLRRYASFKEQKTPKKSTFPKHKSESNITPNTKFVIKTDNVTPMLNYNVLSTPEIAQELGRFGLKPLKRKRGINLLKHIYETTHPKVGMKQKIDEDEPNKVKRKKLEENKVKTVHSFDSKVWEPWSGTILESDAVFERQRSSKISTCQIPLQIVWHNFLSENPQILENILLYEPLQVEVIHKMLKELGFKFHLQDLITFLDQKCITIRIAQNHQNKVG